MRRVAHGSVAFLAEPDDVRLALSPLRRQLLERLREPASATQVATELGLPRQRVNYHLRTLERAGLVELVEERPRRGFVERILVAGADAFLVDPAVVGPRRPEAHAVRAQDRFAAEHLTSIAADVVRDVTHMQAAAAREGTRLLTFALETEVTFAAPPDLERFSDALAVAVAEVADRFQAPKSGRSFRIIVGGHPAPASPA